MAFNGDKMKNESINFNLHTDTRRKILLKAPILTRSGYGEQSRFALRALRSKPELFDIHILPIQWGSTSWVSEIDEEREFIDAAIQKYISYSSTHQPQYDYSLQVTIPNEWESLAITNIGYTAGIETTVMAPEWAAPSESMNNIIVVSHHSKRVYETTEFMSRNPTTGEEKPFKISTPVTAVNYPVKNYENIGPLDIELRTKYNFVCVAQFGPRKNLENTIRWFVEEFQNDPDVGLLIKTNMAKNCSIDREMCEGNLRKILKPYDERKCTINLLHGDMTDEEMHALYVHPQVCAAISFTHGEGFGLPLFEAAYMGVPVVATGWSGQLDFLVDEAGKEQFYNVAYDLNPVDPSVIWPGVIVEGSGWAYPRERSAKQALRKCLDDIKNNTAQIAATQYAAELRERFNEEKMYEKFIEGMGIDMEEIDIEDWLDNLEVEEIE